MKIEINRYKKQIFAVAFLLLAFVLLRSYFAPSPIIGKWKLVSGSFSYIYKDYDQCAIEFTEGGEYLLYTGSDYQQSSYRGSYSYDGKKVSMLVDDIFNLSASCTVAGDRLVLVTSSGSATFTRVDTQTSVRSFDDSVIKNRYQSEGYEVDAITLISSNDDSRTYRFVLKKSYRYMSTVIIREEQYMYSSIGQHWYHSSSRDNEITENWNVNGLWQYGNKSVYIISFNKDEAVVDYRSPDYQYSGVAKVRTGKNWIADEAFLGIEIPYVVPGLGNNGIYTTLQLYKDQGILNNMGVYNEVFEYQGVTDGGVVTTKPTVTATPRPTSRPTSAPASSGSSGTWSTFFRPENTTTDNRNKYQQLDRLHDGNGSTVFKYLIWTPEWERRYDTPQFTVHYNNASISSISLINGDVGSSSKYYNNARVRVLQVEVYSSSGMQQFIFNVPDTYSTNYQTFSFGYTITGVYKVDIHVTGTHDGTVERNLICIADMLIN